MENLFSNVARTTLDNGLTALIKENHTNPIVAIYTYVKAGYLHESDEVVGISHLIEHMFFKGTKKRGAGEIALQTKELGGYLNASTIYDHTLYYTVLPSKHFSKGLEIQADALLNSLFDPKALKKETEVVIQEAMRKLDNPFAVAREKLFELAFDKHRIRRWRIGTEEGLRKLTRDHLLDFHRHLYRPENIILTIVGDVPALQVLTKIKQYYGNFEPGVLCKKESEPEPSQMQLKYKRLTGDIEQGYLSTGFHTPGMFDSDTYAIEMLSLILGYGRSSRLYQYVREEKRLVSAISASNYTIKELGFLMVNAIMEPAKIQLTQQAIIEVIAGIYEKGVTENELERARNLLESFYAFSCESISGQASLLSTYEAQGDFTLLQDYITKLRGVTVQQIRSVVEKYIIPENFSVLEYVPAAAKVEATSPEALVKACRRAWPKTRTLSPGQDWGEAADKQKPVESVQKTEHSFRETTRFKLSNGMTLLVKEDHRIPLVSFGFFAKGGRIDETEGQAGITRFMIRCALQGTQTLSASEVASRIENLGSKIDCVTAGDYCGFSTQLLSKNLPSGLSLLLDIINRPVFSEAEINKEKENTVAFHAQFRDDMFRYPVSLFHSALFPRHPYGYPSLGLEDTLHSLNQNALMSWRERLFTPANMLAVCAGDVDPEKIAREFESGFESAPKYESSDGFEIMGGVERERCETRAKEQTALVLGFRCPGYNSREQLVLLLLQNIVSGLGGRFFEELRSRQSLAYTVSSFLVSRRKAGSFMTYIATSPQNETIAIESLLREFEKLLKKPVTPEELTRAQKYTVGTHRIGLETLAAQMSQYAHVELMGSGFRDVDSFSTKVETITAGEIQEAAQRFFNLDKYTLGIVRAKK